MSSIPELVSLEDIVRNIRRIMVGAALAGALAAGVLAAPAANAAAAPAAAAASAPTKHFFGNFYSKWHPSEDDDFGHRSYFKGYWYKKDGYYWFVGDLFDRDRDNEYSYVWYRYRDGSGYHEKYFGKSKSHLHFNNFAKFKSGKFNDFDIRVCEGDNRFEDCGGWGDAF
ncbi:hypothetical protein Acor_25550 [Acrocarpospora corrugata]|uniref:Uncharacterized protein n=1 Tax=Acrocarpospora corrugata TaxID=35763 RepID=A0A5M3W055_9ACTN|nr:hypothetical protein Acor_25550 [Acrocarpospora corrugata]